LFFVYLTLYIQKLLAVNPEELNDLPKEGKKACYYTTVKNLEKSLQLMTPNDGCPLVMMNLNYMNDPLEGKLFIKSIGLLENKTDNRVLYEEPHVYLKSFTLNYDSLTMWNSYADGGQGVCISLSNEVFGRSSANYPPDTSFKLIKFLRMEEGSNLFKIAYCNDKGKVTGITSIYKDSTVCESTVKKLNDIIELIKRIVDRLNKDDHSKKIIEYYIKRIAYLFKDESFKDERELRILSYGDGDEPLKLESDIPLMATKWFNAMIFEKILFGPKMTDSYAERISPYIQNMTKSANRWTFKDECVIKKSNKILR
jgi:hypothetical protein